MPPKSISGKDLDEAVTSDDILGKDVIDLDGKFIGVTEKVFIHPNSLDFIGIEVDKGFLRKELSIGKDYIERIAKNAVFLNVRVAFEIRGMDVFSSLGEKIGKVYDVELVGNKNEIKLIHVKTEGKELVVPKGFVDRIGHGVFLNIRKNELEIYNESEKTTSQKTEK